MLLRLVMSHIGTLRETSLHAALKRLLTQAGDRVEVPIDGFVADIVRDDLVIEVQTGGFSALKGKLPRLLERHRVRVVHPIASERWIVHTNRRGERIGRRKSPWRGRLEHLFLELVSIPDLARHYNFTLDVILIREEVVRGAAHAAGRGRRRRSRTEERRLLDVVDRVTFASPADYARFLPPELPQPFTCRDLAAGLRQPMYLAQKVAYCLRKMGVILKDGRRGRASTYMAASRTVASN